jgi:hypothetical protein
MMCVSLSVVAQGSPIFQGHVSDDFFQRAIVDYELVPFRKNDSSYKIVTHSHRRGSNDFYASHSAYHNFQRSVNLCVDPIHGSQDICRFEVYHIDIHNSENNTHSDQNDNFSHLSHVVRNRINADRSIGNANVDPDDVSLGENQRNDESSKLYIYGASCLVGFAGVYALYKYVSRHK